MNRFVLPFPVAPGKTDADARSIAAYFGSHPAEYHASRARHGVSLERAYLQPTPMGSVVISYAEMEGTFAEWAMSLLASDLDIDRRSISMVADIHGVDLRQPMAGPPPETVGQWSDPDVTARRRGIAFVAPLLPGKDDEGRAFCREAFTERVDEFSASRRAIGESVEVVTLSVTPMGSLVCGYLEGDDPVAANADFAASTRPFDVWFKGRLEGIFPPSIDFGKPLPPIEELFDSLA